MSRVVIIDGVHYVPAVAIDASHTEGPGDYCRRARKAQMYSIVQIAENVGCSHTTLADFENGAHMPSAATVARIAAALNISLDRMFRIKRGGGA